MAKPLFLLPAVFLVGLAPSSAAAFQEGQAPIPAHVKEVYKIDCALCHNENGDGKTDIATSMNATMGDFTDPKTLEGMTDQQLFDIIRKGKGDKMPPEDAGRAKDADIRGLILYIRSMSKGPHAPAAAPAAEPAAAPAPAPAEKPANPSPGRR